jgi:hypothetical protein
LFLDIRFTFAVRNQYGVLPVTLLQKPAICFNAYVIADHWRRKISSNSKVGAFEGACKLNAGCLFLAHRFFYSAIVSQIHCYLLCNARHR